jgi:hypothetical protein
MAFSTTGFAAIGTSKAGNAPSLYSYRTTDAIADVNTSGYFNSIASVVKAGDFILCVTSTGSTAVASMVYVLTNTGTVVDVSDGTVFAATNGD